MLLRWRAVGARIGAKRPACWHSSCVQRRAERANVLIQGVEDLLERHPALLDHVGAEDVPRTAITRLRAPAPQRLGWVLAGRSRLTGRGARLLARPVGRQWREARLERVSRVRRPALDPAARLTPAAGEVSEAVRWLPVDTSIDPFR
jgi:hypothetical protein